MNHLLKASVRRLVHKEELPKLFQNPKVLILDVRNPDELQLLGKAEAANFLNLPLPELPAALAMDANVFQATFSHPKPALDTKIVTYCRGGVRAKHADTFLKNSGFTNADYFGGSFEQMQEMGLCDQ